MGTLSLQPVMQIDESSSSTEGYNVLQENNAMVNASGEALPLKFNRKRTRSKMIENFFPISQNVSNNNSLLTTAPSPGSRMIAKPHSFNLEQVSFKLFIQNANAVFDKRGTKP